MSCFSGPEIPNSGLVLNIDAANPRSYSGSGTVWTDLSGNSNNGTLVNGTGYNVNNIGTMVYDGVNDYTSSNYMPPAGTDPRTISVWFNPAVLQNKNLLGYGTPSSHKMWDIILYAGSVGVHLYATTAEAGTPYQVGQWQNITFTFTFPTITSYMNGIVKNSYSSSSINTGVTNTLSISQGVYNAYYYFNGSISNVRIYNRALSAAEIKQKFEATRGRYGV
jgi:hypothetical protein